MSTPDAIDEQLVSLLAKNARQSAGALAAELNVNAATVRRRLKKLLETDLLQIVGFVDPVEFGLPLAALIAFDIESCMSSSIIETLAQMPEINWVSTCTGRFDLVAIALLPSTDYLSEFMMKKLVKLEGLKNIETFICLDVKKGRYGVRPETGYDTSGVLRNDRLDMIDKRLVEMLGKDAWQSTETLAQKLDLNAATLRLRLRKLLKNKLLRIVGVVDPAQFGLKLTTVIAFDVEIYKLESIVETLAKIPELKWLSTSTGRFDVVAVARFPSNDYLSKFLSEKLSRLEGLKDVETFICLDVRKGRYAPLD